MRAIKAIDLRENFKLYCDQAANGETLIVHRPGNRNVVVVSENEYNDMLKAKRNAEYLAKIDKSMQELSKGKVVVKTMEELEEMEK